MMTTYAMAFLASLVFVGLKAFQQLNVVHGEYWWVFPTSMAMAFCEVYVMYNAAKFGMGWLPVFVGLGAGIGCVISMLIHKRIRRG